VVESVGLSVPLYNEEPLVEHVGRAYAAALEATGLSWTLALVDNGSTDGTRDAIRQLEVHSGVRGVFLDENAGYGGGIRAGLHWLQSHTNPDVLGWAWGDGQVDPTVIPSLVTAIRRGAHLAKVRRVSRRDGWHRRVVTGMYAHLHHRLGIRSPDVNGCPKLMHEAALRSADLQSTDWFLDPELMLKAEARGWSIVELPVAMGPRAAGASSVNWRTAASLGRQVVGWHLFRRS
jgi:glycosyltransferase involved in cell wall biosynthesis